MEEAMEEAMEEGNGEADVAGGRGSKGIVATRWAENKRRKKELDQGRSGKGRRGARV